MLNYVIEGVHKPTKATFRMTFTLTKFPGDCGSWTLSGVYGAPSGCTYFAPLMVWVLHRIVRGNSLVSKKVIMTYKGGSATEKVAKALRVRSIKTKGAHGVYPFYVGVKTFNTLCKALPPKQWELTTFIRGVQPTNLLPPKEVKL